MLPLDQLSAAAVRAVSAAGFSPDDMAIALRLDLDFEGRFGESWLVYDKKNRSVLRLLGDEAICPRRRRRSSANRSVPF